MDDYQTDKMEEAPEIEAPSGALSSRRRKQNRSNRPDISVNMDELRELIQLVRENDFTEFELEREGFRVRFRRGADAANESSSGGRAEESIQQTESAGATTSETKVTTTTVPVHPGAKAETAASEDQDLHIIPSPIVGTFYRAASPNAESFVKIGSHVEADSVVCIIEAMKLMNEIQAETSGEVVKIYVENGQPVEYGQPLFGIKK
jgi:acetyl-CoA carboxylase biotin carboxyl carrier protein